MDEVEIAIKSQEINRIIMKNNYNQMHCHPVVLGLD